MGLDSAELAKSRVAQRVRDGGHGIPPEDIERRYTESLDNLGKVIRECDYVNIYDNTKSFRMIASFAHGECRNRTEEFSAWFDGIWRGTSEGHSSAPTDV